MCGCKYTTFVMYQCVTQFASQKITAYWYGILRFTVEKVVSGMLLNTVIFKTLCQHERQLTTTGCNRNHTSTVSGCVQHLR